MPHIVTQPLDTERELVITADNSGAIGEKHLDAVHASNETVGYFACRVAMMEQLSASAEPHTIVLHNFTGDEAWSAYKKSVYRVLSELQITGVSITGSTETNMTCMQSGLGLTVIGVRDSVNQKACSLHDNDTAFAVIGTPLVGNEVKAQAEKVAPLALFRELCRLEAVIGLLPVGSKGIRNDWKTWTGRTESLRCSLDTTRSAGPSTCFIIAYRIENESLIRQYAGIYYHKLKIIA